MRHLLLTLFSVFLISASVQGQRDNDVDDYFDDRGGLAQKLWYGGGFTLGFSGNEFRRTFNIGVSPMIGYKIFDNFSIGPRGSILFNSLRGTTFDGDVVKANPLSWSVGVFSRYKLFPAIFMQVEYEFENAALTVLDGIFSVRGPDGDMAIVRRSQDNFYIGAGYHSSGGGLLGYEIVLLYNLNGREDTTDLPIDFRFGINYNF